MQRRDFMTGVAASILLAGTKGKTQVPAQRPRLLISHTDAFTGLALLKTQVCERDAPVRRHGGGGLFVATHGAREFCGEGIDRDARRPYHQGGEAFAFLG